ncbi:MAG TPA: DUF1269 domain-containing protein [Anaeromyxobacteraceae bacterium]|nr:DUF1269 domain-containing protein [Anaeromyxobacteraceae bacterium]
MDCNTDKVSHLWAIGYDDMERADQVKEQIVNLGWVQSYLMLSEVAVVVRHRDGSFTLNREPFPIGPNIAGCSVSGFLAGLVLAVPPLTGAAVSVLLGVAGSGLTATIRIDEHFVQEVERMMMPGASALFVLDDEGDMDVILQRIQGLGGKVLKTNVDAERARLIQETLSTKPER